MPATLEDIVGKYFGSRSFSRSETVLGGINNSITGGAVKRIFFREGAGPKSVIIKITPAFKKEKDVLAGQLVNSGHPKLAEILNNYGDNFIGPREVECYKFLKSRHPALTPFIYECREISGGETLLVMEDLSNMRSLGSGIIGADLEKAIRTVLKELAGFHYEYWGRREEVLSIPRIGNWWMDRDSDFLSKEVAEYSLRAVEKFINDPGVSDLLNLVLEYRELFWDRYNKFKFNTFIHWDLNPGNVFVSKDLKSIKIIDWQLASWGILQWDLVQLLIPLSDKLTFSKTGKLIDYYLEQFMKLFPASERGLFDPVEFRNLFNIVVADHSYRSTIEVLISGNSMGTEWEKLLGWLRYSKNDIKDSLSKILN
ncbi:MAG: hypothetical protein UY28_C0048G0003 [Candidatus Amesbacteria bacterium GW2011_GWB1_48_13]|uniref:CHK kinase-like domain-containing protein n=1 Tax=Candidatus Amesbacteria bacterium GW2011_GWB1_48_13 TaxID=1618362 RepID=A0A0G1UN48_9BACT|nr:MAG: hypothetical protein UY28_C0048G0003 [Candidatus Amesbacteria bacterium GW2011_GWB1_48_13]